MTVHERLEEVFRMVFGDDTIVLSPETTADDIPDWDSLAHINLMFSIEDEFGVTFKENELASFENVGQLERFLDERART